MSKIFDRRSAIGVAGAFAGGAASLMGSKSVLAKLAMSDFEPRGADGIFERLPTLDLESYDEFSTSTRVWINSKLTRAAQKRALEIMKANGYGPDDEVSMETAVAMLTDDPIIAFRNSSWQRLQMHMWTELQRAFHDNYDEYMSEMEATDNAGPGSLELNPGIEPDWAKHEIHMQPGGYTGDPFAGHIYHYGTANFYNGRNYQDERQTGLVKAVPVPADGKVRRILDAGCACGQQTVALKKRFPGAEIWGVDIGAPMVRYAHMRAVDLGVDVNFRHALAEDTGFPDGYFDIVTSYILHHECPADSTYKIIQESTRVLRPGGVYYPVDFYTNPARWPAVDKRAWNRIKDWMTYRWNHERWLYEYQQADFDGEMHRAGLTVNMDKYNDVPKLSDTDTYDRHGNLMGTKPA